MNETGNPNQRRRIKSGPARAGPSKVLVREGRTYRMATTIRWALSQKFMGASVTLVTYRRRAKAAGLGKAGTVPSRFVKRF
jgi:hypothetical protein